MPHELAGAAEKRSARPQLRAVSGGLAHPCHLLSTLYSFPQWLPHVSKVKSNT